MINKCGLKWLCVQLSANYWISHGDISCILQTVVLKCVLYLCMDSLSNYVVCFDFIAKQWWKYLKYISAVEICGIRETELIIIRMHYIYSGGRWRMQNICRSQEKNDENEATKREAATLVSRNTSRNTQDDLLNLWTLKCLHFGMLIGTLEIVIGFK